MVIRMLKELRTTKKKKLYMTYISMKKYIKTLKKEPVENEKCNILYEEHTRKT